MQPGTPENPGPQQPAPPYAVFVEEKRRRNGSWHISLIQPVGGDLAEARATGQNIAFKHQPETARAQAAQERVSASRGLLADHLQRAMADGAPRTSGSASSAMSAPSPEPGREGPAASCTVRKARASIARVMWR
jgi:hypothetical protein